MELGLYVGWVFGRRVAAPTIENRTLVRTDSIIYSLLSIICDERQGGALLHRAGEGDCAAKDFYLLQFGVAVDDLRVGGVFRVEDQHVGMIIDTL